MRTRIIALALALSVGSGACSKNGSKPADTTLNSDLSLAAQQRGYQPLDSLSAAERAAATAPNALNGTTAAPTPLRRSTTSSGTRTRRSSGSGGTVYSSGGTVTSSERVIKHTKRDAAIGAAAGAVIGATTSRNKVKGGIIGAAVGGILGGVIGNNVDKKKVP